MLPVSAPFHCELIGHATKVMENEIKNLNFQVSNKTLVSNVTTKKMTKISEIKN